MSEYAIKSARSRTSELATAALVTALLAAAAWITLPIGAVPITLQVFVVVLAALLLSPGWAAASVALYVALGTAGLPIFSGAKGGIGVLMGPTGGYLIGFVVGAVLGSFVRSALERRSSQLFADVVSASVVVAVIYAIGTVQLAAVTGMGAQAAIVAGVIPFIGIDIAKAAVAILAARAIRRARGAFAG